MSEQVIIACDPGASGALAVFKGEQLLAVEDMPTLSLRIGQSNRNVINEALLNVVVGRILKQNVGPIDDVVFVIEHVTAMPKDGSVQAFAFGLSFGLIRGVIAGHNIRTVFVRPAEWKKALKLKRDKDESRQRALQRWPHFAAQFARVKDDGRAEAALIGLWYMLHGDKA